ncbi:hypothetical protein T492DRAFT_831806 [Pavlovales sp. CCMP2436]|nr:hypothetical protein T492DRAFT_831806 [Pavlovales sp. CCMP2436]
MCTARKLGGSVRPPVGWGFQPGRGAPQPNALLKYSPRAKITIHVNAGSSSDRPKKDFLYDLQIINEMKLPTYTRKPKRTKIIYPQIAGGLRAGGQGAQGTRQSCRDRTRALQARHGRSDSSGGCDRTPGCGGGCGGRCTHDESHGGGSGGTGYGNGYGSGYGLLPVTVPATVPVAPVLVSPASYVSVRSTSVCSPSAGAGSAVAATVSADTGGADSQGDADSAAGVLTDAAGSPLGQRTLEEETRGMRTLGEQTVGEQILGERTLGEQTLGKRTVKETPGAQTVGMAADIGVYSPAADTGRVILCSGGYGLSRTPPLSWTPLLSAREPAAPNGAGSGLDQSGSQAGQSERGTGISAGLPTGLTFGISAGLSGLASGLASGLTAPGLAGLANSLAVGSGREARTASQTGRESGRESGREGGLAVLVLKIAGTATEHDTSGFFFLFLKDPQAFTVYRIEAVSALERVLLLRRYSAFLDLHRKLCKSFTHLGLGRRWDLRFWKARATIGEARLAPQVVDKRLALLRAYVAELMSLPEVPLSAPMAAFLGLQLGSALASEQDSPGGGVLGGGGNPGGYSEMLADHEEDEESVALRVAAAEALVELCIR